MESVEKNLKNNDEFAGDTGVEMPQSSHATQSNWERGFDRQQTTIDIVTKTVNAQNRKLKKINEIIGKQEKSLKENDDEIIKLKQTIHNTELRSIEVIGIISAIIALVLIFVDTANAQRSLKDSYSILITGTASLIIFASLLHHFFNKDDKREFWYYVLFFVIPLLAITVIGYFIFK